VTPTEETIAALDDLVRAGKIRYWGHSNLTGWQIADMSWIARAAGRAVPVSAQNQYSLLEREAEREVVPACERFGLGLLPYFPLASGLLTGKYVKDTTPPQRSRLAGRARMLAEAPWDRIEALRSFAQRRGITMLDVAIGGLAAQPAVGSVIAGATTPAQIRSNASAGDWHPGPDDLTEIDKICPPAHSAMSSR